MMKKLKSSLRFLLDENISDKTALWLRQHEYTVTTVHDVGLDSADDNAIFKYAYRYGYVVITFDLDFGYIFYQVQQHHTTTILLRLTDQTIESVNRSLLVVFNSGVLRTITPTNYFITIDDMGIRIRNVIV